jgi:hypothetical protein
VRRIDVFIPQIPRSAERLEVPEVKGEAPPSLVAIGAAAGFLNFYKSDEMLQLLKHAGFKHGKVYLKKPYFVAVLQ